MEPAKAVVFLECMTWVFTPSNVIDQKLVAILARMLARDRASPNTVVTQSEGRYARVPEVEVPGEGHTRCIVVVVSEENLFADNAWRMKLLAIELM